MKIKNFTNTFNDPKALLKKLVNRRSERKNPVDYDLYYQYI